MKFCVDLGHCLTGAVGARGCGYKEEELNRQVGRLVIQKLRNLGHSVTEISVDNCSDMAWELRTRVNKIESIAPDYSISIHFNAFSDPSANGTEVWVDNYTRDMGNNICKELSALGLKNRGTKYGTDSLALVGMYGGSTKALLIECCFITNSNDMAKYSADKFANAIVKGITGKTVSTPNPTPSNLYRIRKTWNDVAGQKGAFKDLNNAKECADNNSGYSVFDSNGNKVYPVWQSKQYLNLNPHMSKWNVYPTNVAPVTGNQCGALAPSQFGGLSYEILGNPQCSVYTIQTSSFGKVNIYAPADNDSSITGYAKY